MWIHLIFPHVMTLGPITYIKTTLIPAKQKLNQFKYKITSCTSTEQDIINQ